MCIRIIGASNRRYAYIGDIVVAVIKKAVPNSSLERSEVIRAVIVRTCKELKRSNGIIIKYDDNAAVLIDKEGNPKGTRIFSAIARELRQLNFTKENNISIDTTILLILSSVIFAFGGKRFCYLIELRSDFVLSFFG